MPPGVNLPDLDIPVAMLLHLSFGSGTGIRTRVSSLRGMRPSPLDDVAIREV